MTARVLLADDHHIVRQGLRSLLDRQKDVQVVGEADNGRAAVQLALKLSPDIVVMDIGMPALNGVEATRQIVSQSPNVKVIALSMHSERQFVARMLEAGASGYLLKDTVFEELAEAIRVVREGGTYLCRRITPVVVGDYVKTLKARDLVGVPSLTPREREVLQLIAEGNTTKGTALRLSVSVKTVETHRQHIMEKLGIDSVAELTKYAVREGLTSLDE